MSPLLPAGWKSVPLNKCGHLLTGGTPSRARNEYWGGDLPWISAKSLKAFQVSASSETLTPEGAAAGSTIVPAGTVLFVVRGMSLANEFRVGVSTRPVAFNQDLRALVPSANVHAAYLGHFLRASGPRILTLTDAASHGTKRLTSDRFAEIAVPLPPLAEQRRIAAILDQADELRAKRRRAIHLLEGVKSAVFLEMFGDPVSEDLHWPSSPLGQLLAAIESGWSPVCQARPVVGDEWGVLKLGAVTWCEYDPSENKALLPSVQPESSLEVQAGDLLFSRKNTESLVAACALVRETPPRLLSPDLMFRLRLRPKAPLRPSFLQQLLVFPSKRREIQALATGSAGSMPNISKQKLSQVDVMLPPLSLQEEFERRADALDRIASSCRASESSMDDLFACLQDRAFSGAL